MQIINLTANPSGAYPPIQSWDGDALPNGYATIPNNVDTTVFYDHCGFVSLTVKGHTVTNITGEPDALAVWQAEQTEPEGSYIITETEIVDTLLDYEMRILSLELGM